MKRLDSDVSNQDAETSYLSLQSLLELIWRFRYLLLTTTLVAGSTAAVVAAANGREYASEAKIAPSTGSSPAAGVAGLAAQFGVRLGGDAGDVGSDFYAELIRSWGLHQALVGTSFDIQINGSASEGTLIDLYSDIDDDSLVVINEAIEHSLDNTEVNVDPRSGILTIAVTAPGRVLAVEINRRILDLIVEFNNERRQSRAAVERDFAEARLEEATRALREAEQELRRFLEANRSYEQSPELVFEAGRLEREVAFRQDLQSSLAQAYEQARIDAVKATPVISIVQEPEDRVWQSDRSAGEAAALGGGVGLFLTIVGILVTKYVADEKRRAVNSAPQ